MLPASTFLPLEYSLVSRFATHHLVLFVYICLQTSAVTPLSVFCIFATQQTQTSTNNRPTQFYGFCAPPPLCVGHRCFSSAPLARCRPSTPFW